MRLPPRRARRATPRRPGIRACVRWPRAARCSVSCSAPRPATGPCGPPARSATWRRERAVVTVARHGRGRTAAVRVRATRARTDREPPAVSVVRLDVTQVSGRGRTTTVSAPVLVIGRGSDWSTLRWHDEVQVAVRLGPAEPGDDVVAVATPKGAVRVVAGPGGVFEAADAVRERFRSATAGLWPDARGLVPALVVGDTSHTPPDLTAVMLETGLSHLSAVSGSNVTFVLAAVLWLCGTVGVRRRVAATGGRRRAARLRRPGPPRAERREGRRHGRSSACSRSRRRVVGPGSLRSPLRSRCCSCGTRGSPAPTASRCRASPLSVCSSSPSRGVAPWHVGCRARSSRWDRCSPSRLPPRRSVPRSSCRCRAACPSSRSSPTSSQRRSWPRRPSSVSWSRSCRSSGSRGAGWLAWGAALPAQAIAAVARWSAGLPFGSLDWGDSAGAAVLLAGLTAGVIATAPWAWHRSRHRPTVAVAVVVLTAGVGLPTAPIAWPPPGWALIACDVGQGDGLVADNGNGHVVVIDAGPDPEPMRACLDRIGATAVDLVVLTHYHADHVGGPERSPRAAGGRDPGVAGARPACRGGSGGAVGRRRRGCRSASCAPDNASTVGSVTADVWWPARRIDAGFGAQQRLRRADDARRVARPSCSPATSSAKPRDRCCTSPSSTRSAGDTSTCSRWPTTGRATATTASSTTSTGGSRSSASVRATTTATRRPQR